jgi:hypothetical protein
VTTRTIARSQTAPRTSPIEHHLAMQAAATEYERGSDLLTELRAGQNVMGTAVFWGMLIATGLGVFLIPGNFTFVEGLGRRRARTAQPARQPEPAAPVPGEQHA